MNVEINPKEFNILYLLPSSGRFPNTAFSREKIVVLSPHTFRQLIQITPSK